MTTPTPRKRHHKPRGALTGKEKVGEGSQTQTSADLAANYQWSIALLNSDPDLRKLFRHAVKQGWSGERFAAEMQDSPWFKKHAAAWRVNETQRIVDPATWNAARKANQATLTDAAAAMGAVLTPAQIKKISDNTMAFGWNDAQQRNALAEYVKAQTRGDMAGQFLGQAGEFQRKINDFARRNGYTIPAGKMDQWMGALARGDSTVDDYAAMMRERAALSYPSMADQLRAGQDLDDLVTPYKQSMAQLLEIPEDKIGLDDRTLRSAMTYRDASGKNVAQPLYEFEDQVRKDDRWQYTDNATSEIMGKTLQVGRMFGKTG